MSFTSLEENLEQTACYWMDRGESPENIAEAMEKTAKKLKEALLSKK